MTVIKWHDKRDVYMVVTNDVGGDEVVQAPGGAEDHSNMRPLLQLLDGRRRSHGPDAIILWRRQGGAGL